MSDLYKRFLAKVTPNPSNGCWVWTGHVQPNGYGQFSDGTRLVYAHRFVFEMAGGIIPENFDIDHLCRNRRCVNPLHLEPVTHRENLLRGETIPAARAAQTHCISGHPLSGENLYVDPSNGSRSCRICKRASYRRWLHKNRARRREIDREHYRRKIHG